LLTDGKRRVETPRTLGEAEVRMVRSYVAGSSGERAVPDEK
jgi:hypothetical protein